MHASQRRDGLTRIEVVALLTVCLVAVTGCLGAIGGAQETARGNTCRSNLRAIGMSVFQYSNELGALPGYINVLKRDDGTPYADPLSRRPAPVSWAVMILPYVDQAQLYQEWRKPTPSDTYRKTPIPLFQCPSDSTARQAGPSLSFVVNSGMPDLKSPADVGSAEARRARDRAANGMMFDNFFDHPLIQPDEERRRPMVTSSFRIKDPSERTILLTENVDATTYCDDAMSMEYSEVSLGCVWNAGPIDSATSPPTMKPSEKIDHSQLMDPGPLLAINEKTGKGNGYKMNYCRPSSHHPGGVNMTFVGQNTLFVNNKISYYVYAKLMASDDAKAGDPGSPPNVVLGSSFAKYELKDEDYAPKNLP